MIRLTRFELRKLWGRRSFLLTLGALLLTNLLLLWYLNLSDGMTPELSSYRALAEDLAPLSEPEKERLLEQLDRDLQGVRLVNDVLHLRALNSDMGDTLASQAAAEHPGVFERYHEAFLSGRFLKYTGSLEQETALIDEVCGEARRVLHYGDYREAVSSRREELLEIPLFSSGGGDSFSRRNIEKEAEAYRRLGPVSTSFAPSRGLVLATQAPVTDLLLFLLVFLFVGGLLSEEKERGLFYITRATAAGRTKCILSKLAALGIHCLAAAVLFYGADLAFAAGTAGVGDLARSLQSASPFLECPLGLSVGAYLLLSAATKGAVLFAFGALLLAVSVVARHAFLPYLAGLTLLASGVLLYALVPPTASVNWLKYLNPIGLLHTENLYGGYLNFNLFGFPVSRLPLSLAALGLLALLGCGLTVLAFARCRNLELSRLRLPAPVRFRPHAGLLRHEGYKLLIMHRGLLVLLLFSGLFLWDSLSRTEMLTPQETYYQRVMLQLEGRLTPEKEALIRGEQERYEAAFAQLDRIDALIASGAVDRQAGEAMKAPLTGETAFFPSFQRVLRQYDHVRASGGVFVYDTGYARLLDEGERGLTRFLLLLACAVLAFSPVFSGETQKGAWPLLGATRRGWRAVVRCKTAVCAASSLALCLVLWSCRFFQVLKSFPLHQAAASTLSLGLYRETGLDLPIFLWVGVTLLLQLLAVLASVLAVLLLSHRLKSPLQTLFSGALLLLAPPVLSAMGLPLAEYFSLYPLYRLAGGVPAGQGAAVALGYAAAAALLLAGGVSALQNFSPRRAR